MNAVKSRPKSSSKLRRPESEYSRQRKQYDPNPRYKYENIANMELDMPEKTTQDFEGPGMSSRVDPVLGMSINEDDGDDIEFSNVEAIASPFLHYGGDVGGTSVVEDRTDKRSKGKNRPSSARRRGGSEEEYKSSSNRSRK